MKKINFLTILLSALLVSGSMWAAGDSDAANGVAQIGDQYYSTLQLAVNDVPTTSVETEIKMLKDILMSSNVANIVKDQNVKLDLNGREIRMNLSTVTGEYTIMTEYGSTLTVDDSSSDKLGKIVVYNSASNGYTSGEHNVAVLVKGDFALLNGTISNEAAKTGFQYALDVYATGKSVKTFIKGGKIKAVNLNGDGGTFAVRLYSVADSIYCEMTGGEIIGAGGIYQQSSKGNFFNMIDGKVGALNTATGSAVYTYAPASLSFGSETTCPEINGQVLMYYDEPLNVVNGNFTTHNALRTVSTQTPGFFNGSVKGGTFFFNKKGTTYTKTYTLQFADDPVAVAESRDYAVSPDGYGKFYGDLAYKEGWEALGYVVNNKRTIPEGLGYWYDINRIEESTVEYSNFLPMIVDGKAAVVINEDANSKTVKITEVLEKPALTSGNWSDAQTTWGGEKPNEGSEVTIAAGRTITVDENASVYALNIEGGKIIVKETATLIVGRGGVAANTDEIIIKSDAEGTGVLLISPESASEAMPEVTVELFTKGRLIDEATDHNKWQFFSVPVVGGTFAKAAGNAEKTYLNYWDGGHFQSISKFADVKDNFAGYVITTDKGDASGAKYEFKGKIVGNNDGQIKLTPGFHLFGNSYTAPMDIVSLLKGIVVDNPQVSGSVWIYNSETENYEAISILKAKMQNIKIAPLQSFMMYMESGMAAAANCEISYQNVVWCNDNKKGDPLKSPARKLSNDVVAMDIVLSSTDQRDVIMLYESDEFSSDYDNGADVRKLMNPFGAASLYASTELGEMSDVASDQILGTQLSLRSGRGTSYTISFENVLGTGYALKDNVTGQVVEIVEGNTYSFSVVANTTIANRFEVVDARTMPTGMQRVEEVKAAKGIYTILGQPIGSLDAWDALPAGIYVVDGQKLAK